MFELSSCSCRLRQENPHLQSALGALWRCGFVCVSKYIHIHLILCACVCVCVCLCAGQQLRGTDGGTGPTVLMQEWRMELTRLNDWCNGTGVFLNITLSNCLSLGLLSCLHTHTICKRHFISPSHPWTSLKLIKPKWICALYVCPPFVTPSSPSSASLKLVPHPFQIKAESEKPDQTQLQWSTFM